MANSSLKNLFDNDKGSFRATHPSQEVYTVSKTIVIDSRQRNTRMYPHPSYYRLNLDDVFKNISSIELKGVLIPKTSYNIHNTNNKIDFAIGDFVNYIKITNPGSGYTSPPTIFITNPENTGVNATAFSYINTSGSIYNISITDNGSGYIPGNPPAVIISPPNDSKRGVQAKAEAVVGIHYTAVLREGEYIIGGNPIPPSTSPSNLLLEIQNAMNYAVNGGNYDPISVSPFAVRIVSQYPTLNAVPGSPEYFDTNCCKYNRIQITNVNSNIWELLWGTGVNKLRSANSVLGFNITNSGIGVNTVSINTVNGELIPAGTTIRANFDYNLLNDPDFVIMSLELGDETMDRIKSFNEGLDQQFATLLFDSNTPETLQDLSGNSSYVNNVNYLEGNLTRGTFWRDAGRIKPLKGYDFDVKKFSFKPPKGKVSSMMVKFTKFGSMQGGEPIYYDFSGREHTLIFEVGSTDQRSKQID